MGGRIGERFMSAVNNLRQINLNSLPVLREILRHGSIAKAADVLNLTPPALSNTLRQLRGYFDDELITRQGREMHLTPKAAALLQPLELALSSVQDILQDSKFDAAHSTEQFQIAMTDHSMGILAAPLVAIMANEAPHMRARFMGVSSSIVADFAAGKIDMIVSPRAILGGGHFNAAQLSRIRTEHLRSEPLVCIGHIDDQELTAGISIEQYLKRPHAGFYLNAEQHASIEQAYLASMGYRQHDRFLMASYLLLPMLVAMTGCLSLVPLSIAVQASQIHPIQFVKPPIDFPEFELAMVWHERDDAKPMNKWLRQVLARCVSIPESDCAEEMHFTALAA
jgi:LysR family transcriptional regulator, nod-box dependent transcriptional activator